MDSLASCPLTFLPVKWIQFNSQKCSVNRKIICSRWLSVCQPHLVWYTISRVTELKRYNAFIQYWPWALPSVTVLHKVQEMLMLTEGNEYHTEAMGKELDYSQLLKLLSCTFLFPYIFPRWTLFVLCTVPLNKLRQTLLKFWLCRYVLRISEQTKLNSSLKVSSYQLSRASAQFFSGHSCSAFVKLTRVCRIKLTFRLAVLTNDLGYTTQTTTTDISVNNFQLPIVVVDNPNITKKEKGKRQHLDWRLAWSEKDDFSN